MVLVAARLFATARTEIQHRKLGARLSRTRRLRLLEPRFHAADHLLADLDRHAAASAITSARSRAAAARVFCIRAIHSSWSSGTCAPDRPCAAPARPSRRRCSSRKERARGRLVDDDRSGVEALAPDYASAASAIPLARSIDNSCDVTSPPSACADAAIARTDTSRPTLQNRDMNAPPMSLEHALAVSVRKWRPLLNPQGARLPLSLLRPLRVHGAGARVGRSGRFIQLAKPAFHGSLSSAVSAGRRAGAGRGGAATASVVFNSLTRGGRRLLGAAD